MTKAEKQHYEKLFQLGCIVCQKLGHEYSAPHIHHIRHGAGMGRKNHYSMCIPLCPTHHQHGGHGVALHAGQKTFEENFGTEEELLAETLRMLDA